MCLLALQAADFVFCYASAYTPLSCRFRELYVNWHGHQVFSEEFFVCLFYETVPYSCIVIR